MPGRFAGKYLNLLTTGHTPQVFVGGMPNPKTIEPIANDYIRGSKPLGGFWTSSYTGDRTNPSSWYKFWYGDGDYTRPPTWLLQPKPDVRVWKLGANDIDFLPRIAGTDRTIDFESLVHSGIDGIQYTPEALKVSRLRDDMPLYGVDVESTVWLNGFPFRSASKILPADQDWRSR